MKFTLVEADIKQAIQDYISKIITINPHATIDIDIKATRGADGVTAEIDVALAGTTTAAPVAQTARVEVVREPAPVAPATPVAEPVGQTVAPVEPTIPDEDEVPLEPTTVGEDVAEVSEAGAVPGKSIFG